MEIGDVGGLGTYPRRLREPAGSSQRSGKPGAADRRELTALLVAADRRGPLSSPIGVDAAGQTTWLDLSRPASRHVLVEGGASSARSEVLRSIAIGLAMTTRPASLQILAIDTTGRELSVLQTVPHAVTETANDAASAQVSLMWLAAELRDRVQEGRCWPEMVLVIDDLLQLVGAECARGRAALTGILRSGGALGIHVLAAIAEPRSGLRSAGWSGTEVARVILEEGGESLEYVCAGVEKRLTGVSVSAVDLDRIARGWRPNGRAFSIRRGPPPSPWSQTS